MMMSRIAKGSVAAIIVVSSLAPASAREGHADDPAQIERVTWSTPDHDSDGRRDWLQLDLSMRLPAGGDCVGSARLDQAGRHVADGTTVAMMEFNGMLSAEQIPSCNADSSGRCVLRFAFDGAGIRFRGRDGRMIAHVEAFWNAPGGTHAYRGVVRQDITSPPLETASFRRAPCVADCELPQADRLQDSIKTARAAEEGKASIKDIRSSGV